jgi:hypothetical protein
MNLQYIRDRVLPLLVFYSIFIIYIKILPIDVETQPFIVYILALIGLFLYSEDSKNSYTQYFIYIQILVLIIYGAIDKLNTTHAFDILSIFKYTVGPVVYLYFVRAFDTIIKIVNIQRIIVFFFVLGCFLFFDIPVITNLLRNIQTMIVARGMIDLSGARGISILTPEPSYVAFYLLVLMFFFDLQHTALKKKYFSIY